MTSLIERLQKLKAKAQDKSITEEEAALYAAKVSELLSAHNLSEAALEIKEEDQSIQDAGLFNSKTGDPWAQVLGQAVAKLYFCDVYLFPQGGKKQLRFVGRVHNIEVARSMTEYLIRTIGRLAGDYSRSPAAKDVWDYSPSKARYGFERGAGARLTRRVNEMRTAQTSATPERAANGNPANLPALYQDEAKAVVAYLATKDLRKGSGRGSSTSGSHARNGWDAAASISLQGQVANRSTRLLQ